MGNLELTMAKFIIVALLIVIAILVFVIFVLGCQINKMVKERMQEEKEGWEKS